MPPVHIDELIEYLKKITGHEFTEMEKFTILEYKKILQNNPEWNNLRAVKQHNIFAVDANSFFSKPSLRTITGIEILAKIIHPDIFENEKNSESFKQIKS